MEVLRVDVPDERSPPDYPPPELNKSPSPTEEALSRPLESPPPEAVQASLVLEEALQSPEELPEPKVQSFEVKIHKSPSDRYSEYSSPDTSRDFPQLEDSCVDRILAASASQDPESQAPNLYIEPPTTVSPPVEHHWEPVRNCEVPLTTRYRVHDRHSCRICQTKKSRASLGTRSAYVPSLRSSVSQFEPTESLKKCADCFNRYPWYFENCPHCEVKVSLARAPDSRYKQKVLQWCTN